MIRFAAETDPGKRRDNNEDAHLTDPENGLFVVADGVGGRACGEIASAMTIETFRLEPAGRLGNTAQQARPDLEKADGRGTY